MPSPARPINRMKVVIIGNGISGITAARFIRKRSDHEILVISAESPYFFSRTALMYVYMGHLRPADLQPYEPWFWAKNRIQLQQAAVASIDTAEKALRLTDGTTLSYDKLVLALGSRPNKFGWPGQDLERVGGLYHWQDLEAMERASAGLQRAVVVGGGLIGIEMAEMFHSRHIPVTFLVRETSFWNGVLPPEESAMINRHIREHGIDLRLETELQAILDEGTGAAQAVITGPGERIECGYVGLTAGVSPNLSALTNSGIATNRGILVDPYLQTNIPDVYAIGDCAELQTPQPGRRSIEAVWYTGRMMGETVAYTLCGQPTAYDPGIWFNSAKFFDIEYQVYGTVPNQITAPYASLYWEHPGGQKSIRVVYLVATGAVVGFNLMGIRFRQEQCQAWIAAGTPIAEVVAQLGRANFDPEFYRRYEKDLAQAWAAAPSI